VYTLKSELRPKQTIGGVTMAISPPFKWTSDSGKGIITASIMLTA
jgi:hypothetical protein